MDVCKPLVAGGAEWGYCVAGLVNFLYYVGYPPLLYLTFLADFFREVGSCVPRHRMPRHRLPRHRMPFKYVPGFTMS